MRCIFLQPVYSPTNVYSKVVLLTKRVRNELACLLLNRINLRHGDM